MICSPNSLLKDQGEEGDGITVTVEWEGPRSSVGLPHCETADGSLSGERKPGSAFRYCTTNSCAGMPLGRGPVSGSMGYIEP